MDYENVMPPSFANRYLYNLTYLPEPVVDPAEDLVQPGFVIHWFNYMFIVGSITVE